MSDSLQDHAKMLTDNAVAYLNVDVAVSGKRPSIITMTKIDMLAYCRLDSLFCLCQSSFVSSAVQCYTISECLYDLVIWEYCNGLMQLINCFYVNTRPFCCSTGEITT